MHFAFKNQNNWFAKSKIKDTINYLIFVYVVFYFEIQL